MTRRQITIPQAEIQAFFLHYVPGEKIIATVVHTLPDIDGSLQISTRDPNTLAAVDNFFANRIIPWLEAQGLMIRESQQ